MKREGPADIYIVPPIGKWQGYSDSICGSTEWEITEQIILHVATYVTTNPGVCYGPSSWAVIKYNVLSYFSIDLLVRSRLALCKGARGLAP